MYIICNAIITQPTVTSDNVLDFSEDVEVDDIYGDYDFSPSVIADMPREGVMPLVDIDITDGKSVIDKLIDVFGATREIN